MSSISKLSYYMSPHVYFMELNVLKKTIQSPLWLLDKYTHGYCEDMPKHLHRTPDNNFMYVNFRERMITFLYKYMRLKYLRYKLVLWAKRKVLKKRYKLMCDVDLSCEPFVKGRYEDIYVADTIYRFSNSDIIKIFNMALCYNVDMIPEPQQPKNPYTSIKFNINERTILYNQISHVNSDVIMRFRMSKLNILSYTVENMQFVRENVCRSHVDNMNDEDFCDSLEEMYTTLFNGNLQKFIPTRQSIDCYVKYNRSNIRYIIVDYLYIENFQKTRENEATILLTTIEQLIHLIQVIKDFCYLKRKIIKARAPI